MGELTVQENREERTSPYRDGQTFGRPILYSDAVAQSIIDKVEQGITLKAAANSNGITYETLRTWAHEREDFSVMLMRARGAAEAMMTEVIVNCATGQQAGDGWRPATEYLKRVCKDSGWGDQLDVRNLPRETVLELLASQQDVIREDTPAIESAEDVL